MVLGVNGKLLRVNLSDSSWHVEPIEDSFWRLYYGGWGLIAYYLLKELPPGVDPLAPENKLIFANGLVTGAAIGGSGRHAVGAKSPLINGFGEADVGGFWGAELARTGYDAILIEGKAPAPVYLWIKDGEVEIRSAEHLWGCLTARTQALIHEELGDHRVRVAQIGPAGEKLSPIAAIMHDINRAAARTGLGAVMGSKNLKAVAVRGSKKVLPKDAAALNALAKWYAQHFPNTWANDLRLNGTASGVISHQLVGGLPTRNFQQGVFEGFENISGDTMTATILKERDTCFACPVHCKRVVEIQEGRFPVDAVYGGPEYETIGAFGSMCAISDLAAIARANQLCNAYGMDTISAGVTLAWAMDCFERGLITLQDTGGLDLRFGNAQAMVEAVEQMGKREGFGYLLSQGSLRAARALGRGTEEFAIQVKGQEVPMHEPRIKYALGIGYAVSPTGADHNHNVHDTEYTTEEGIEPLKPFGINQPLPIDDLSREKMRLAAIEIPWSVTMNLMGFCGFIFFTIGRPQLVSLIQAVTGWDITMEELLRAGERAYTLARVFNLREGLTAADDRLPKIFHQPFKEGPSAGNYLPPDQVEEAKKMFYELLGWDRQAGIPTKACLERLEIAWAEAHLPRTSVNVSQD
jgi:aldehyde:ferredoxin oxidoreductase